MGLLSGFTSGIKALYDTAVSTLKAITSEVTKIIDVIIHIHDYTVGVVDDATALIEEAKTEWDEITNFKFVVAWKTRVVSVPKVFDNIRELLALPQKVVDAIKDLISNIRTRISATEAAEAVEEVIPGIGQAAGIVTLICEILLIVKQTIADLKVVVDAIQTLRKDIEDLDLIFLQNRNPRKNITTEIGTLKIRTGGRLHG
jgi:hypothetical protein